MFTSALTKLIDFIFEDNYQSLDHYIIANDPQSTEDVERLEREYDRRRRANFFTIE